MMFRQSTNCIRRVVSMSCKLLFVPMALSVLTLAQSKDPANPTLIGAGTFDGQSGPEGVSYYYRFKAPKGTVTITLKGQTNYYSTQFEADVTNLKGDDLGKIMVPAGEVAKSDSKQYSFENAQDVNIRVLLLNDGTLKWQKYSMTLSGAVGSGGPGPGGGEKGDSSSGLPDLVFSKVEYEEGGQGSTPGSHKAKAIFCVKNAGNAEAGPFRVRLAIHNGDSPSAELHGTPQYFQFAPLLPGKEVCKSHFSESNEPVYIGRGRLLWVDPGGEGEVKESNEKNNKAWTNFPPKGVDVRKPGNQ